MKFDSVTVIGLGLIGGSVCRAIKKSDAAVEVVGIDSDEEVLKFAVDNGIVDRGSSVLENIVDSELVVIATYVDKITETVQEIFPSLNKGCVITDVGSVKSEVVSKIEGIVPAGIYFVGSHPIAGSECSGIENSDADLFNGKNVIVTPTEKSEKHALDKVTSFWASIGGKVISLDPETHDRVFAYVSHLPHLVAYSLVNSVGSSDIVENIFSYSGGGLKDFTRISASSPEMWKTIFLQNKEFILESIKNFKLNIEKTESAIRNDDLNELMKLLENAHELKSSE